MLFCNALPLNKLQIIQTCQTGKSSPFLFSGQENFYPVQALSITQRAEVVKRSSGLDRAVLILQAQNHLSRPFCAFGNAFRKFRKLQPNLFQFGRYPRLSRLPQEYRIASKVFH